MNMDESNYKTFLDGDISGFENLVITYKDNLIYFINRYVHDLDLAEDIAQDTFVEIFVHKERYDFRTGFKTYLFTIGRNKAVDYMRKNKHYLVISDNQLQISKNQYQSDWYSSLEDKVIKEEEKRLLYQIIKQLKLEYQEVLYLIDIESISYQDAGKVMNKSNAQIKIMIHRARKALAKLLLKEWMYNEK